MSYVSLLTLEQGVSYKPDGADKLLRIGNDSGKDSLLMVENVWLDLLKAKQKQWWCQVKRETTSSLDAPSLENSCFARGRVLIQIVKNLAPVVDLWGLFVNGFGGGDSIGN